ncbi:MAG: prolyl oligopeptidase family serine peptidase [Phycisphaerales bacterium]|nr:prolyl oligopeptidase family serine peptidase [Phycisphaerales bacterium]
MVWTVENQERIALLHVPDAAATAETPVVFAFHGHGGSARQASRSFAMHTHWPEAIVVYMEGLPTPGALTDPEGKRNGWQKREGLEGDRDLKFFDAVLATLKKEYKVDARRVYAMGHSNGGGFTYLLWQTRPDVFAAFAPSGAFTLRARSLAPKPAMHIAGKKDPLVKFEHQERTIEAIKKANGCAAKGEAWAEDCTIYSSKGSSSTAQEGDATPLVTLVHEGGHKYPAEAPALIVRFFKGQAKTAAKEVEASSTK